MRSFLLRRHGNLTRIELAVMLVAIVLLDAVVLLGLR